jgi:hypothetical protein
VDTVGDAGRGGHLVDQDVGGGAREDAADLARPQLRVERNQYAAPGEGAEEEQCRQGGVVEQRGHGRAAGHAEALQIRVQAGGEGLQPTEGDGGDASFGRLDEDAVPVVGRGHRDQLRHVGGTRPVSHAPQGRG